MISGRVSAELDPLVTIEIRDAQGDLQPVEVVVDTGFSGFDPKHSRTRPAAMSASSADSLCRRLANRRFF